MREQTRAFDLFDAHVDKPAVVGFAHIIETVLDVTEDRIIDNDRIMALEQMLSHYLGAEPVIAASVASLLSLVYHSLSRHTDAATVCGIGLNAVCNMGATKVAIFLRVQQASAALAHETISQAALYIEDAARLAQAVRNGRHPSKQAAMFVNDVLREADGPREGDAATRCRPRRGLEMAALNSKLSPRETEIIALVAEGYLTKEIAVRLGICGTVKSHRKKIPEKLGVASRAQAVVRARELLII